MRCSFLLALFAGMISSLHATTYTVNSLANTNTGAGTNGTLLYCVTQANLSAGPHTINFSVAGTIPISSNPVAIPNLIRAITIDASTAPGYAGNPVVILNGTGSTAINGLTIAAASCQIYGLEIINFPYRGVYFSSATASNCTFGATGKGNVVRANGYYGVQLQGADNNIISYNRIGVNAAGSACSANGYDGIDLTGGADNNQILNNHVSCNGYNGLQIGNSHFNIVKGNIFGPLSGTCSNNGYRGIDIEGGSHDNVIGGTLAGEANKIAGNLYWGIEVKDAGSIRNIISANSISCNDYGGIEVNTGGHNNIATPVITSATPALVSGTSLANAQIQVFRAQDPALILCPMAPTPNNQGVDYLGSTVANGAGAWSLAGTFNGSLIATQRDAAGNTSEFSAAVSTGAVPTFTSNCPGFIVLATDALAWFRATCEGPHTVNLDVQLQPGHDLGSLRIERSWDAMQYNAIATYQPTDLTHIHQQDRIEQEHTVFYRVSMTGSMGEQHFSAVEEVHPAQCKEESFSLEVFPNPAQDWLMIVLAGEGAAVVSLVDAQGHTLHQMTGIQLHGSQVLDWKVEVAPGFYTVSCMLNGRSQYRKLIVL
jgi:hypothetical protein